MKKIFVSFIILVLSVSLLLVTVSASTDSFGNEYLNVNEYASYNQSADGTKVYANLDFPADWTITNVFWDYVGNTFGASDLTLTGNNINLHNESYDGYFSLCIYPFNRSISVGVGQGYQIRNSKIFDLRYLPSNSTFSYDFLVKVENPTSATTEFGGVLREDLVYVDENGKILQHDINYIPTPPNYNENGYRVIKWGGSFSTRPVAGAVGFIPFFSLRNIQCDWDTDIIVQYNGLSVNFSMSNLDYDNLQNGMLSDTINSVKEDIGDLQNSIDSVQDSVNDVENKIDNAVNGEAEVEKSPVDDNVNGLIGEEDKLINDTQQGRENIVTYISQAIAELTAYATAFVALNAIIDGFFYLPILGPLIIISLSMGIFAMVVNLAQSASRSDKATKPKGKGKEK